MKQTSYLHWSRLETLLQTHTTYALDEVRRFLRRGGHRIPISPQEQQKIYEDQYNNIPIAETAFHLGVKPSTVYAQRRRLTNAK